MKQPRYLIAASVPEGNRILRFHGTGKDSASALLKDIPTFRWGGFDVVVEDEVRLGPDDSLEIGHSDYKFLRLYQDGTLLFQSAADHEFLGWGQEPEHFDHFPGLNPVAVVEVNTSFIHFYKTIVEHLQWRPEKYVTDLLLAHGAREGSRLFLTKYYKHGINMVRNPTRYVVQSDPAKAQLELQTADLITNPNHAAYQVLVAFASMFDMPEEEIPFTKLSESGKEVDLEAIVAL